MIDLSTIKNGDTLFSFEDKHVRKCVVVDPKTISPFGIQCATIYPLFGSLQDLHVRLCSKEQLFYTAKEAFDEMLRQINLDCIDTVVKCKKDFSNEYPEESEGVK